MGADPRVPGNIRSPDRDLSTTSCDLLVHDSDQFLKTKKTVVVLNDINKATVTSCFSTHAG